MCAVDTWASSRIKCLEGEVWAYVNMPQNVWPHPLLHASVSSYMLHIIHSINVVMSLFYNILGGRFTPAPPPLDETLYMYH